MNKNLTVLILAAGTSSRLKNDIPKPFIKIKNKPILWYSLYSFQKLPFVKKIYIIISPNHMKMGKLFQQKYLGKIEKFAGFLEGGKERQNSVYNALKLIKHKIECNYIAVHDAARPFIKPELIKNILNAAIKYKAAACGIPVTDTIKICDKNKIIVSHPIRNDLIAIQTPQIFLFTKLWNAYKKTANNNTNFTDDTEIYGKHYDEIKIINGDKDLFKITFKEDLIIAKSILKKYKNTWT